MNHMRTWTKWPAAMAAMATTILIAAGGCRGGQPGGNATTQPAGQSQSQPAAEATATGVEEVLGAKLPVGGVRQPAVAGMFYQKDPNELATTVDDLLAKAEPAPVANLRALICPHAGYEFSGLTAAHAYKLLAGRKIATVAVLAPSHTADFKGASVAPVDSFQTPLGDIKVSPLAAALAKQPPFEAWPQRARVGRPQWWRQASMELPPFGQDTPHTWEHSLEVQLPLLQRTLKDFTLIPVVYGKVDPAAAAKVLARQLDANVLIVASSDLSHYYPYEVAVKLDQICVRAITDLDFEAIQASEACGMGPILTVMHLARMNGWQTRVLKACNSGDATGQKEQGVVGYAAIAFYEGDSPKAATQASATAPAATTPAAYGEAEHAFMLKLARTSLKEAASSGRPPAVNESDVPAKLKDERACFVTLTVDGQLRGCIGSLAARQPLYKDIIENAQSAAVRDPRFPPVKSAEVDKIHIEISVLTTPRPLKYDSPIDLLCKLRPHVDGVILKVAGYQSTYLPTVWDQIPNKIAFLCELSKKAGLGPTAWTSAQASIMTYQSECFGEGE